MLQLKLTAKARKAMGLKPSELDEVQPGAHYWAVDMSISLRRIFIKFHLC